MSDLLERLGQAGEYDSTGRFTLDAARARRKLARFQLTDPRRFVLELVACAVGSSAGEIRIESGGGRWSFTFDGVLDDDVLDDLDAEILGRPSNRRHLAIALSAISQLEPQLVRVTLAGGTELCLGNEQTTTVPASGHHRVEVMGLKRGLETEIERILRDGTCFCRVPIRMGTTQLNIGAPAPGGPPITGQLSPDLLDSCIRYVRLGVTIRESLTRREIPIDAVVVSDDLNLNASHSDLVEDDFYQDLQNQIQHFSLRLLRQLMETTGAVRDERTRPFLIRLAANPDLGLDELPLLRLVDGSACSLSQVVTWKRRDGRVRMVAGDLPAVEHHLEVVRLDLPEVSATLRERLGSSLENAEQDLLRELEASANRAAWQTRPRPASLEGAEWLRRVAVKGPGFSGELGLDLADSQHRAILHVLYQGRLLSTETLSQRWSYVAVVDFAELEIKPDWSGPADSPGYRAALKTLEQTAQEVYQSLKGEDLDAAVGHILSALKQSRQDQWKPFAQARLFPCHGGGAVSLADLESALDQGREIFWLPPDCTLPKVPPQMLPQGPILCPGPEAVPILKSRFGKRLKDMSGRLGDLQRLAQRFQVRRQPDLNGDYRVQVRVESACAWGQLGLLPNQKDGTIEVLHQGVSLGNRRVPARGPGFAACLECPEVTPNARWDGLVGDAAWDQVLQVVAEAEREAARQALHKCARLSREAGWRSALLRLLDCAPELWSEDYAGERLFPACSDPVSLVQVREQQQSRGEVLVTSRPQVELPAQLKVPFLLLHDEQACLRVLQRLVPELNLRNCDEQVEDWLRRDEFQRRPARTSANIEGGVVWRRQRLNPPWVGEVAWGPDFTGQVELLVDFRPVQVIEGVLPPGLAACLTNTHFHCDPTYSRVLESELLGEALAQVHRITNELIQEIVEVCGRAPGGFWETRHRVPLDQWLQLLAWPALSAECREALLHHPCLSRLPGGSCSLADVLDVEGAIWYVPEAQALTPSHSGPVIVLDDEDLRVFNRFLARCHPTRKVQDYSRQLRSDVAWQKRLRRCRRVSTNLPPCLIATRVDQGLCGRVGIPRKSQGRIVLTTTGAPVEVLDWSYPLVAVLEVGLPRGDQAVALDSGQEQALEAVAADLYAELANSFAGTEPERSHLLQYTCRKWRYARGVGRIPDLVGQLSELPLVLLADGAYASLSALQSEVAAHRQLLCLTRRYLFAVMPQDRLLPDLTRLESLELLRLVFGNKIRSLEPESWLTAGFKRLSSWWSRETSAPKPQPPKKKARPAAPRKLRRTQAQARRSAEQPTESTLERLVSSLESAFTRFTLPRPGWLSSHRDADEYQRLLAGLRRTMQITVTAREARRYCMQAVNGMQTGRYLLGPPTWWDQQGTLRLNVLHPSVRYIKDNLESDPAALQVLLVHVFCTINLRLDAVTDAHERDFLQHLATTLAQAFPTPGAGESPEPPATEEEVGASDSQEHSG